jgi:hypothetical protein
MALVTRFDTPASLRDAPSGSTFYDSWHAYLAGQLAPSTMGSGGGEFYDPSEVSVAITAERSLVWMGFPRALRVADHRDDSRTAFALGENRDVQEEYCEWHVQRDAAGKIVKVTFVTETPEYWEHLWTSDPTVVVGLYRSLVSPAVVQADLEGPGGGYNRFNRWNTTDGIVHFIQSINTLNAALGLSQGSVDSFGARDNYEASPGPRTSVDPRVKLDIGAIARKGLSVTLREPIGLYITGWDDTGWTKPDGSPVGNYWRIVRGSPSLVLRLDYEVPAGEGFVVGDISIGGRPIEFGGQIAEHVTCMVGGVAGRRTR